MHLSAYVGRQLIFPELRMAHSV